MLSAPESGSPGVARGRATFGARSRLYLNQLPWKAREGASRRSPPAPWYAAGPEKLLPEQSRSAASVQGAERSRRAAGGPAPERPSPPGRPLCPSSPLPSPLRGSTGALPLLSRPRPPVRAAPTPPAAPWPRVGRAPATGGHHRAPLPPGYRRRPLLPSSFGHGSGSSASGRIPPSPSAPGGPAPRCL